MKLWRYIKTGLYLTLSVLIVIFFDALLDNVRYVVGPLMILYGVESIAVHLALCKKFSEENNFFWGIFEVMLGVILIFSKEISYGSACIIWAIWTIFRETKELEEIFKLINKKIPVFVNLIESVLAIVFSITMVFEPVRHHVTIHAVFLIVELVTTVILPYFNEFYVKRREKRAAQKNAICSADACKTQG